MSGPLYLVRHGESEWNLARRTQGQTAHPALTATGREQAATAGRLIAADLAVRRVVGGVGAVVSSDLVRAEETARLVAQAWGVPLALDPRLREQHLGSLEGRTYEETWAAAEAHDWSDPELDVAGGESPAALARRMRAGLADAWASRHPTRATVVVSHGDALRAVLADAHAAGDAPWIEVPNGAVFRVECGPADGGARLTEYTRL